MKHELQQLDLIDADEINCKMPDDVDAADLFDHYYIGDAVMRPGGDSLAKLMATGSAIHKILISTGAKPIWTDYDASIRLTHGYLKRTYVGNLFDKDSKILYKSAMDVDICVLGLASCRLGDQVTNIIKRDIIKPHESGKSWRNMISWNRGMELVRLKSMTPEAHSAHDKLRDCNVNVEPGEFDVSKTKACRTLNAMSMYRIMGLYIFEYSDTVYVLDFSSMDQVHQVSKMWEDFYKYATNYRLTGMGQCKREITVQVMDALRDWIVKALKITDFSR